MREAAYKHEKKDTKSAPSVRLVVDLYEKIALFYTK